MPQNHRGQNPKPANGSGQEYWQIGIEMDDVFESGGNRERAPSNPGTELQGRDFSNYNRELRDQIDPETRERVQLLTRKQFLKLRLKELKDFGE